MQQPMQMQIEQEEELDELPIAVKRRRMSTNNTMPVARIVPSQHQMTVIP